VATQRRDLVVGIGADPTAFEGGTARAGKSASAYERELAKLERQQARTDQAMRTLGRGMFVAGAAIAAGLALSVKAAIDWESAWAGVLKTVDGTPEQMAALEEEIRGLTAVLPASHREIAAVAEAAGQLGVKRQDVAAFTKTMIDMGEATNLSSDEAATAIARFMNIMQTAPDDVDRLASAIVDLGNKGATTESEIAEMSLRIAGAGRTIGLSEQQVLGFAAALSNVGINAEAGGTAISKVFLEIDTAVSSGSDKLTTFAKTAGMTADEFAAAYQQDAGAAITEFVVGLGRVQERGGDVNAILNQLGLTEIRVSDALRRLAGSGDNLTTSLQIGSQAWDENNALAAEAARRYGTTAAQAEIARNQINDFAIDIGQTFLPAVGNVADTVATLGQILGDLPGPAKALLGILGGLAAVLLLAGGAAFLAVPRVVAFSKALDHLAASGGRAAATVGVFRGAAAFLTGPFGLALGVGVAALTAFGIAQARTRAEVADLTATLDKQTGAITLDTKAKVLNELESSGMAEQAAALGISMGTLVEAALGDAAAMEEVRLATAGVRAEQEAMMGENVSVRVKDLTSHLEDQNKVVKDAQGRWQRQSELMDDTAASTEQLTPQTRALADSFDVTAGEAEGLSDSIDELDKELKGLFDVMFSVEEAEDAAAQAMRRLTEQAEDNGAKIDGNSEAALANRDAVRDVISADMDLISTMAESGASAQDLDAETERLRQRFIKHMLQLGFTKEEVERYAEAYDLVPSAVATRIRTPGMTEAERRIRNLKASLDAVPDRIDVSVNINQAGTATVGSQWIGHQHGGEIRGPAGPDRVPIMATAGEIMIRREVAQPNRAALLALNATGRFPVGGGMGMSAAGRGGSPPGEQVHRFVFEFRGARGNRAAEQFVADFRGALQTNPGFRADVRGHR
jgi:TP901 family phage tail tape measure protein